MRMLRESRKASSSVSAHITQAAIAVRGLAKRLDGESARGTRRRHLYPFGLMKSANA